MAKRLDTIGWYIATLHQILGHDKAAAAIGQPAGDRTKCILCQFEAGVAFRNEVLARIGV